MEHPHGSRDLDLDLFGENTITIMWYGYRLYGLGKFREYFKLILRLLSSFDDGIIFIGVIQAYYTKAY